MLFDSDLKIRRSISMTKLQLAFVLVSILLLVAFVEANDEINVYWINDLPKRQINEKTFNKIIRIELITENKEVSQGLKSCTISNFKRVVKDKRDMGVAS